MRHLTLDDVPHCVFEALCGVLDEEPCSFERLVLTAKQAGLELQTERIVEQWLEKQKAGDFVELIDDRWQIRGYSDTSKGDQC